MGIRQEFGTVMRFTCAAAAILALSTLALRLTGIYKPLVFFMTISFPPLLLYFYLDYLRSKRSKEIDHYLPTALLQIASFPEHTPIEQILESLEKQDYGALSEEFLRLRQTINSGSNVPNCLGKNITNAATPLYRRTLNLLLNAYESGSDFSTAFREISEDAYELQNLQKEQASAFAMQKYTLIFGGALLVPFILALLLGLSAGLDFSTEFNLGLAPAARKELIDAIMLANQLYLGIFALLSSYFVSSAEGNPRKTVLYFCLLCPLSLLVFHLVLTAS